MGKEKVDKRLLFLLTFLLVAAVLLLYTKVAFTGNAVISGDWNESSCTTAGYAWNETIEENCTDMPNCSVCSEGCLTGDVCEEGCVIEYTQTLCEEGCQTTCDENDTGCVVCEEGCVDEYTETLCAEGCVQEGDLCEEGCQETCQSCEEIVTGGQCLGDVCDAEHLDLCLDETECASAEGYWYDDDDDGNLTCNSEEEPSCSNDLDLCLDETNCTGVGGGYWYDDACHEDECASNANCDSGYVCNSGTCEVEETSSNDNSNDNGDHEKKEIPTTTLVKSPPKCVPNWQCDEWSECVNETQDRTCVDVNVCDLQEGIPAMTQSCVVPETCFDGVKNQNETGIDCGGPCEQKCSIFTIVGSAVSGPLDAGKKFFVEGMFGNVTRMVISIGVFVLIIGAFIAFELLKRRGKFSFDKKKKIDLKKLDEAIDNLPK